MNLGQTLLAILALVLLGTIAVTINNARVSAIEQTVDLQLDLEAISYGQSIVEVISNRANTEAGYSNLGAVFHNWTGSQNFPGGSGRTLYAKSTVQNATGAQGQTVTISVKIVTVSVYEDAQHQNLLAEYKASFNRWW